VSAVTGPAAVPAGAGGERPVLPASQALARAGEPLWGRILDHPFVRATGDGSLPAAAFDRWLGEDHAFVVGFRRFLAGLVALAPDEPARDVLSGALAPLQAELDLFRREAARRGVDLGAEPGPTTLGYTGFLQASLQDGYPVALTVLYGAEKAYHDAWLAVRERASEGSPYWPFVDNWSSPAFAGWVADVAALVDAAAPRGATDEMVRAFLRVVRFELRFWDAVHTGEVW
jgi:formylaminopyrimidine deformylase / aminopyrimidine aminohydrolase